MPSLSPLRPPSQGINHPFRLWGHRPHGLSKSVKKKNLQQFILLFNLFIKLILPHSKNYHVPWGHIFLTFLVFKNTLSSDGMMAITNLYLGFNAFNGQDSKLVTLWYLFAWFNFFFFFYHFKGTSLAVLSICSLFCKHPSPLSISRTFSLFRLKLCTYILH